MNHRVLSLLAALLCTSAAFAQQTQLSPGVGNAVLLATNSIQIDNGVVIVSGDVIVNNATAGPVFGELALSLNNSVVTPAGYKLAATSIDLFDRSAIVVSVVFDASMPGRWAAPPAPAMITRMPRRAADSA